MVLTVLGSGTGWLRPERSAPSYLVSIGSFHLVLDLGPGALRQLIGLGLSLNDVSAIFISHFHPDHVTEIIPFFFATRYSLGYHRQNRVYLLAHERFKVFHQGLKQAFGDWVEPKGDLIEYILIPDKDFFEVKVAELKFKTARVNHNPESLALRIEHQGKSLVYSGDTGYSENLITLARDCDLLVLECSNSLDFQTPYHLGPEEVAQIAQTCRAKGILISHLYPHSEPLPLEIIQKNYSGKVLVAHDYLQIEL